MKRWFLRAWLLALCLLVVVPAAALAAAPGTTLFSSAQFWVLVIGSLVALVGYVLNHFAPWVSEPVKAVVQAVLAAVASACYTAIATSKFGWNMDTAQLVLSAVVALLVAHKILWLPSGISALLGGGSNSAPTAGVKARGPAAPHAAAHRGE